MVDHNDYINKIFGSYRITAKIASGGFALVYQGQHIILTERKAAIKLLHAKHLDSLEKRESFIQEARLLETLKHPHILPIYDINIASDGTPYLVVEYAPNGSLEDRIKLHRPLPLDEVLTILAQVGQALEHAHRHNVIHRDLKPANILFNAKDEALLADFGIATVLDIGDKQHHTIIGTLPYMAPEQFRGIYGKESDQYALGCIAYELVTGHRPVGSDQHSSLWQWVIAHTKETIISPTQYNSQLPEHIAHTILTAIAKNPNQRYPDVGTFIKVLLAAPPLAKPQKTLEQ